MFYLQKKYNASAEFAEIHGKLFQVIYLKEKAVIAKEWNKTKNAPLMPSDVKSGSSRKVWWICSTCGYEWETAVCNRTKGGTGCPKCGDLKKGSRRQTNTEDSQISIYDIINIDQEVNENNLDIESVDGNANNSKTD